MGSHCTKKAQVQTEDQDLGNEIELFQGENEKDLVTNTITKPELRIAKTTLLDLPPEIVEKVFTYLPAMEVYCNVRSVCCRLRDIGDGYIQTGNHAK